MNIKNIFSFLFWIFIFVLLVFNGARYLDPDFAWHLRVGQEITNLKEVPDIEHFDYTLEGQSWVDHEWGANYLTYQIYDKLGYFSLIIFFAIIAFLSFYLLYLFILKKYSSHLKDNFLLKVLLLLLILLGVYASFPHLGVRMQEFTLLNIVFLMYIFEAYSKTKNSKYLFWFFPLIVLWVNVHAGFMMGLALIFAYLFINFFQYLSYKHFKLYFLNYDNVLEIKQIMTLSVFSFLAFLASFINPYGLDLYSFLKTYSNDYYLKHIVEWLPVYYLPILYKQIIFEALSLTVVIIFLVFALTKYKNLGKAKYKIRVWDFAIYFLFLYFSFKSKRHFPLFFMLSMPFIFSLYIELFDDAFHQVKKIVNMKITAFFVISVLLIVIIGQSIKINFVTDPFNDFCDEHPCQAVQYFKDNPNLQEKRILNDYGWGGFLIWELPDLKLFIDGRLPQFKLNGHSMLEEYKEFFIKDLLEEKLNEHKIETVLMKASYDKIKLNWFEKYFLMLDQETINDQKNELKEYLDSSPEWKKVFSDKISIIYVKI